MAGGIKEILKHCHIGIKEWQKNRTKRKDKAITISPLEESNLVF